MKNKEEKMASKLMLEFPVLSDDDDKCMSSFDIMEVMCVHQVLDNHSACDDRCRVEFKNGKSITVAVGYGEFKERFNSANSNSSEVAKFPFRNMKNMGNGYFGMDGFKEAVKDAKTDDFKELGKLWTNMKNRKS